MVGCSLREFLCKDLGLKPEYLDSRVQTIFLNHHPVDNLDEAWIREGSVVALSAAMPGLAGAVLRKGGSLAGLRKITYTNAETSGLQHHQTTVAVKFFNAVAKEMGREQLKKGVRILTVQLLQFFKEQLEDLKHDIRSTSLDGKSINLSQLAQLNCSQEIILQIHTVGLNDQKEKRPETKVSGRKKILPHYKIG